MDRQDYTGQERCDAAPSRGPIFESMRCLSVGLVSVALLLIMLGVLTYNDMIVMFVVIAAAISFYVTIPVVALWLYSFWLAIWRRTRRDRILLYFHIADVILAGATVLAMQSPLYACDADIMANKCDRHGGAMREIVIETRKMVPDSTNFMIEIGNDANKGDVDILTDEQYDRLVKMLKSVDCIGLDLDNSGHCNYSTVMFRREGMGMYSFRFYDVALSAEQRDSLNDDYRLIVYNDSTVFEYGGGVFGPQGFIGKEEFMNRR